MKKSTLFLIGLLIAYYIGYRMGRLAPTTITLKVEAPGVPLNVTPYGLPLYLGSFECRHYIDGRTSGSAWYR